MKQLFEVFLRNTQHYEDGRVVRSERPIGTTWATSEAKAINNVKFRNGIKDSDCFCDGWGDSYSRISDFRAEKINRTEETKR